MSVLPADIFGQHQSKIEKSKKAVTISDNSLKIGPIFTNNNKENEHLSKSDENVPPEISDKVPDNWKHASFDLDDYARGIKPTIKYHCLKCDKKYEDVLVLNHHFKITHEKENLFKCKICYKTFKVEQNLKQHVTLYHAKQFSTEVKLHQCSKCPNFYENESSLKNHVILMH